MKKLYQKILASIVLTLLSYVFFQFDFYSLMGVGLIIFFGIKLFSDIGKKIEIKDIIIVIAILQWIIGPLLTYRFFPGDKIYYMAVDRESYMSFVVPATYAFIFGMYFPLRKIKSHDYFLEKISEFMKKNKNWDLILIFMGIVSKIVIDYVPVSLKFFFFLFSGLRFVGLYFLFLSERKHKMLYVYLIIGWLFITALNDTMFHELILWLGFFGIIVAFIKKINVYKKILYLLGIIVLIIVIQTVKFSYRKIIYTQKSNKILVFSDLVKKDILSSSYVSSETNLQAAVLRINQGWIIARIMYWTPKYEPFARGETIERAINASLVPRFLVPDKVKAGGRTYFKRFTGKNIGGNTSMGLGLLGEAYANYGINGGILFMFIIAFFYNIVLAFIYKIGEKHPTVIFFLPLIFLQVVKAEIDFSVIINHLVKASLVVWFFYFVLQKFFNFEI